MSALTKAIGCFNNHALEGPLPMEEYLLSEGFVREEQLYIARQHSQTAHSSVVFSLNHLGYVDEIIIAKAQSALSGCALFEESPVVNYPLWLLNQVPMDVWQTSKAFPVRADAHAATLAVVDFFDLKSVSALQAVVGPHVSLSFLIATYTQMEALHRVYCRRKDKVSRFMTRYFSSASEDVSKVLELVDLFLDEALDRGASDVHFVPEESGIAVRLRIDGVLTQMYVLPKYLWLSLRNRLKILGQMDIAESRLAQDGRFTIHYQEQGVDCRLSAHPLIDGESLAIRFLHQAKQGPQLHLLGFSDEQVKLLEEIAQVPEGMVVITGPTGSGKTTTLYALLNFLNSLEVNIMTLEDPVEYRLPMIRQTQISQGFNFADGIRSILRQDPDVLLLGEIRDAETAKMALHAALTGHKILTSVHTIDVARTIFRMKELGVSSESLLNATVAIISQRLLRMLCSYCKVSSHDSFLDQEVWASRGCQYCNHTGYKGRFAVAEIVVITPSLRQALLTLEQGLDIEQKIRDLGIPSLWQKGLEGVRSGITSLQELGRVVGHHKVAGHHKGVR